MNLLSFNKTNPNLTVIPFKEDKCTSSETQTCEEGRKKKEKESYPDVKKEERKRKKSYPDSCEEGSKKEKRKNLKNEDRKKNRKDEYVGVGGKGSVCRKLQEIFFFFWALPIAAF